ncbi:MAG: YceI family protein [SAR324 cluster bacterium]|nr:YceI family protein [SAR324 cluster bacterium]
MLRWIICSLLFVLCCGSNLAAAVETFTVDTRQSEIRILLYKDGALARLAHNHVIVSKAVAGSVDVFAEDMAKSSFQLSIPVASLIVDDSKYRQEEGKGFDSEISSSDQQNIRKTMLDEDILNVHKFPDVTVLSKEVMKKGSQLETTADVTIKGTTLPVKALLNLSRQDSKLLATGSVKLKQSEFGIEPISLFLGAIKVQDDFVIKFRIVAHSSEN